MSYDLCLLPQAKKPYYIENIRMNIYSLEELCFYLYNNACLIDESLLNERLLDWLRDELGLTRLYRQLYDQLEKKDGIGFLVLPIFREAETSACGWLGAAGCPTNFRVVVFLPPYREAVFSAVRQVEKAGPEIRPRLADEY